MSATQGTVFLHSPSQHSAPQGDSSAHILRGPRKHRLAPMDPSAVRPFPFRQLPNRRVLMLTATSNMDMLWILVEKRRFVNLFLSLLPVEFTFYPPGSRIFMQ